MFEVILIFSVVFLLWVGFIFLVPHNTWHRIKRFFLSHNNSPFKATIQSFKRWVIQINPWFHTRLFIMVPQATYFMLYMSQNNWKSDPLCLSVCPNFFWPSNILFKHCSCFVLILLLSLICCSSVEAYWFNPTQPFFMFLSM